MSPTARPVVVVHSSRGDDHGWASRTAVHEGARLAGRDPDEVVLTHACAGCGSDAHGRPLLVCAGRVLPVRSSLSRARGLSVVALAVGVDVGVDVEQVAAAGFDGFDEVALHPRERATTPRQRAVVWTRKESLLKACGTGLRLDPRSVRLSGADEPPRVVECPGLAVAPDQVQMSDLDVPDGWVGAVTLLRRRPAPAPGRFSSTATADP